jgi:hypothetical protein
MKILSCISGCDYRHGLDTGFIDQLYTALGTTLHSVVIFSLTKTPFTLNGVLRGFSLNAKYDLMKITFWL